MTHDPASRRPAETRTPALPPTGIGGAINQSTSLANQIASLPPQDQEEIVVRVMRSLPPSEIEAIIQQAGRGPVITSGTVNYIWRLVITALVLILVGSAVALIVAILLGRDVAALLTVFSAITTLLAGILIPSPLQGAFRAAITSGFQSSSRDTQPRGN